jgi:UDP-3-O-[3-hydroxymyristoyl] glucosamine N-acyltransferase
VVVSETWEGEAPCAVIRVKDPDRAFAEIVSLLVPGPEQPEPGVHPTAVVAGDADLGPDVSIGPHCVLEPGVRVGEGTVIAGHCYLGRGVEIGAGGRLYPMVAVRESVRIGERVIIHCGAVVGSDGFGYVQDNKTWRKIPQVGTVDIGDDVEIGANVTIDRARFGKTVIGDGVKIDNLVQVAHNVKIGAHTAIAGMTAIAGSVEIGRHCRIGGLAGIAGHLTLGDNVIVAGKAGVTKDVPSGSFVSGFPAMPHRKATKMHAHTMRLPQLKERVETLERRLSELEAGRSTEP